MWGDVPSLNSGPFDAFANASSVAGVGMFPEGTALLDNYLDHRSSCTFLNADQVVSWHRYRSELAVLYVPLRRAMANQAARLEQLVERFCAAEIRPL